MSIMAAKAYITAEFATPKEVASHLKISAARTEELRRQMADLGIRLRDGSPRRSASKQAPMRSRSASKKK